MLQLHLRVLKEHGKAGERKRWEVMENSAKSRTNSRGEQ